MALLICLIFSLRARGTRARGARGKNKNMIRPLPRIFLRGLYVLYHAYAAWAHPGSLTPWRPRRAHTKS
jgi:hypothetical protein